MELLAPYGPYAFGIFSLVVMWHTIVKPQMEANRASLQLVFGAVNKLNQVSDNLVKTGETMERLAVRCPCGGDK